MILCPHLLTLRTKHFGIHLAAVVRSRSRRETVHAPFWGPFTYQVKPPMKSLFCPITVSPNGFLVGISLPLLGESGQVSVRLLLPGVRIGLRSQRNAFIAHW